jgi:hypothetical protein
MKSDYDKWVAGELVWDRWNKELVLITPEIKASMEDDEREYFTYEQFNDWDYIDYETFKKNYTTPSGEEIVSFGYYGYDG